MSASLQEQIVKAIFVATMDIDPSERDAFLSGICPDREVRQRVEQLLRNDVHIPEQRDEGRVGEFRIIGELGRGGMGVVHLAMDEVLGRLVALKTLNESKLAGKAVVERFFQEARAAAQLASPHIVQIYQFGSKSGRHFIAMEYVDGETLAAWLPRQGEQKGEGAFAGSALPGAEQILRIARAVGEIAAGLAAAHGHTPPVIHRDVKPSNILIGKNGTAKITDFGIAKVLSDSSLTVEGQTPCTPQYMSPEQAAAASAPKVDHRSDIFSLGVVLYELLAHRRPFPGEQVGEIMESLRNRQAPPLHKLNPAVPKGLSNICHKAIEKRPEDRYQSAPLMAEELRNFVQDLPLLTPAPSVRRRAGQWVYARRRPLAAGAGVAAALLVAGLIAALGASWRAARVLVSVDAQGDGGRGGVLYAERFDDGTLGYEPAVLLGATPVERYMLSGSYRLTVLGAGDEIAELDVRLDPARERELRLSARLQGAMTAGMARVPAGDHTFGRAGGAPFESRRQVHLSAFWIDVDKVSNADYKRYVDATGAPPPPFWAELGGFSGSIAGLPVVGLTVREMEGYASWAGKRLPTVFEWEAAARYPDGRRFPWGDAAQTGCPEPAPEDYAADREASDEKWLLLYRRRARGVVSDPSPSALGLRHLLGNGGELTSTVLKDCNGAPVIKGGDLLDTARSWGLDRNATDLPSEGRSLSVGFRCVRSDADARRKELKQ